MKKAGMSGGAITGIALLLMLTGCSRFSREWREARKQPAPANDITGAWEGKWISDVNGHNGRLRCVMTRKSDSEYDAHFQAKYRKILSFGYTVPMHVTRQGESFKFDGEADLGKLAGGTYSYSGAASPTNFFSTYDSKYDHGKFEMGRPK